MLLYPDQSHDAAYLFISSKRVVNLLALLYTDDGRTEYVRKTMSCPSLILASLLFSANILFCHLPITFVVG